jgi:catechol 2,3-dioxygenase-like lactoylglutathione lyase family enzyme
VSSSGDRRKVRGIGGIFFKTPDPTATRDWYRTHLGLNTDAYGTTFEWRQADDSSKPGFSQWSPFSSDTTYFGPPDQAFMINYRVDDLEALVAELRAAGVTVVDEIAVYDYGKFVHVLDLHGQQLELWEPNDEHYQTMVGGVTK